MTGKKGMKWGQGKKGMAQSTEDALRQNLDRVPRLLDEAYDLAIDDKTPKGERIKAINLLLEKAVPKTIYTGREMIFTADDFEMMEMLNIKALEEEKRILNETHNNDQTRCIKENRISVDTQSSTASYELPNGQIIKKHFTL